VLCLVASEVSPCAIGQYYTMVGASRRMLNGYTNQVDASDEDGGEYHYALQPKTDGGFAIESTADEFGGYKDQQRATSRSSTQREADHGMRGDYARAIPSGGYTNPSGGYPNQASAPAGKQYKCDDCPPGKWAGSSSYFPGFRLGSVNDQRANGGRDSGSSCGDCPGGQYQMRYAQISCRMCSAGSKSSRHRTHCVHGHGKGSEGRDGARAASKAKTAPARKHSAVVPAAARRQQQHDAIGDDDSVMSEKEWQRVARKRREEDRETENGSGLQEPVRNQGNIQQKTHWQGQGGEEEADQAARAASSAGADRVRVRVLSKPVELTAYRSHAPTSTPTLRPTSPPTASPTSYPTLPQPTPLPTFAYCPPGQYSLSHDEAVAAGLVAVDPAMQWENKEQQQEALAKAKTQSEAALKAREWKLLKRIKYAASSPAIVPSHAHEYAEVNTGGIFSIGAAGVDTGDRSNRRRLLRDPGAGLASRHAYNAHTASPYCAWCPAGQVLAPSVPSSHLHITTDPSTDCSTCNLTPSGYLCDLFVPV
jgi:hypothetical protein